MDSQNCFYVFLLLVITFSCKPVYEEGSSDSIQLDPNMNAPLSATFTSSVDGKVSVHIDGKGEKGIPVDKVFKEVKVGDIIPILGLYSNYDNEVTIIESPIKGKKKKVSVTIQTSELDHYPEITIDSYHKSACSDLMTSFCHFRGQDRYCLLFDNRGEIRWYLSADVKNILFKRLRNGNMIFFDTSTDKNRFNIYNQVGDLIISDTVKNFHGARYNTFHHDILEMDNGNLIVPMQKIEADGIKKPESILIEIDLQGNVYQEWDFDNIFLNILKDENDTTPNNLQDSCAFVVPNEDWLHINSIEIDESDQSFILSSQRWFIFKVGIKDKRLKWIIGDESREWYTRFPSLRRYSLRNKNTDDFDPPRGQHAVRKLSNGNLLFFNNGYADIYNGGPHESKAVDYNYSCAAEYELDESNHSYKQVWQYGKELGIDNYAFITSNVQQLPNKNRFISFNSIRNPERNKYKDQKIVELKNSKPVFSATISVDPVKFTYQNTRATLYP